MRRIAGSLLAVGVALCALVGCAHQDKPAPVVAATPATPATPAPMAEAPVKPAPAVDISAGVTRVQGTDTGFTVTEKIQFADGKAAILPVSESLLGEVATVLKDNADLQEVYIAGYTSSEGGADRNQKLSQERAASVKTWLVAHGVDAKRLVTGGLGPANPTGDNATEEGREKNRRVEFTALKYEVGGMIHTNTPPVAK